ncbi:hypothetical protein CFC21_005324 [Triticum aestivum]|uniref:Uncharacterized protein n=2 Tax=Triticum aestivum TaxID=4565 RepID=A0A9R1D9E9_WHEAT|nr:hypothetical protein CFC21_005324 [Triticum aestivum]
MARRRRRNSPLETPSSAGDIRTAMLLYQAPSGIAVFSFDVSYLNGISKAFWKSLPSLSLEVFIKSKMVPSPIDSANKFVDSLLADSLIELCLCGSEKTLFVGSAEHKRIIEATLGIICLYVDVPDCEMIVCHLKDHVRNLLSFPDDASAMLLHEAPSGIAIFSFDESYLNGLAKDFWTCLPPLSLVEFMAYERVPTPIDLDNEAIDDRLAKRLMKLCGSEKKLVVGSAAHKRIIEMKVEKITCLYVDIPDCEVIICSLKKPMGTLLPHEEKADPMKNIISFLHQHDFDIPGGKVEESYYAPALRLHEV